MFVVTGPSGNVSSELTTALAAQSDIPYKIAARNPQKIQDQYGAHVPTVRFDFGKRETWGPTLDGCKTLFLLFPLPHPVTAKERMAPFVEAARDAGVEHIIYVSVPGADKLKFVPHYWVEKAIRDSGVNYTILEASYFAQNFTRAISSHIIDIALKGEVFVPTGKGKTSFLDSRDLSDAIMNIIRKPEPHYKKTYVVSGPERLDMWEVAQIFSEELGRDIRYVNPSLPRFLYRYIRRGVPGDVLFFMSVVYTLTRFGKNEPLTDILPELLGKPPRTFRDYVRDYKDQWTPEFVATLEKVVTPGLFASKLEVKKI